MAMMENPKAKRRRGNMEVPFRRASASAACVSTDEPSIEVREAAPGPPPLDFGFSLAWRRRRRRGWLYCSEAQLAAHTLIAGATLGLVVEGADLSGRGAALLPGASTEDAGDPKEQGWAGDER